MPFSRPTPESHVFLRHDLRCVIRNKPTLIFRDTEGVVESLVRLVDGAYHPFFENVGVNRPALVRVHILSLDEWVTTELEDFWATWHDGSTCWDLLMEDDEL